METRIAKLEKRWPPPQPASTEPRPDYSALTPQEMADLDQLLAVLEAGDALTPEDEKDLARLEARVTVKE